MRNLKKALSLCLAFVMLLGLMMIGAGAINSEMYSDTNQIAENRQEAVDLLRALQIMGGTDSGTFGPNENLQRDQAAKIVAWANLGKDANGSVAVPATAPFSDIGPNSEWALPYIVYCKNLGIINGISLPDANGAVEFAPTAAVSGYELAKMLLCVVGYGVNGEYTGGNWNMRVAVDAQVTGLTKGIDVVNGDPISRQDAAQMVFNALTMEMVAYSELYGTYSSEFHQALNPTLLGTKAEQVFGVRTYEDTDLDGTDFHYWRKIGSTAAITDSYDCDEIKVADIHDPDTTAKMLATGNDFSSEGVEIWENGVQVNSRYYYLGGVRMETVRIANDGTHLYGVNFQNNTGKVITYRGQKITLVDEGAKCKYDTVYEVGTTGWGFGQIPSGWASSSTAQLVSNHTIAGGSNGAIDKILVTTEYLGVVSKVDSTTNEITATVYAPTRFDDGKATSPRSISVTLTEGANYKQGDYVLVVPRITLSDLVSGNVSDDNRIAIADKVAPTLAAATVTAYSRNTKGEANGSVTTGGTSYRYNGVFANYNSFRAGEGTTASPYTYATATANDGFNSNGVLTSNGMPKAVTPREEDESRGALGEQYTRNTGDEYYVGKGKYTFYMDSYNNVIGVKEDDAGVREFAYIVSVGQDSFYYYNTVDAILSDGTRGTYSIARGSDGYDDVGTMQSSNATNSILGQVNNTSNNYARPGYVYRYSLNGNVITLTDVDNHNGVDEDRYDAVKDIYRIYDRNSVGNEIQGVRVTNAWADVQNGPAFTRGSTAFRYVVRNREDAPVKVNTLQGTTGAGSKDCWRPDSRVAYVDSKTVFVFVYGGTNNDQFYAVYNGTNEAPTISQDATHPQKYSVSMILRNETVNGQKRATAEYVIVRGAEAPAAVSSTNHFVVLNQGNPTYGSGSNGQVYLYDVVLNGTRQQIATNNANLQAGDVCTYRLDANGYRGGDGNTLTGLYLVEGTNNMTAGIMRGYTVTRTTGSDLMSITQNANNPLTPVYDVSYGGASVWNVTNRVDAMKNGSGSIQETDTITVIYSGSNGSGNTWSYTASEVYVTARRSALTVNGDGTWSVDDKVLADKNLTGRLFHNAYLANGASNPLNMTGAAVGAANNAADLFIKGSMNTSTNIDVTGRLTVTGDITLNTISGTSTRAKINLNSAGSVLEVRVPGEVSPGVAKDANYYVANAAVGSQVILGTVVYERTAGGTWNYVPATSGNTTIDETVTITGTPTNPVHFTGDVTIAPGKTVTLAGNITVDGKIITNTGSSLKIANGSHITFNNVISMDDAEVRTIVNATSDVTTGADIVLSNVEDTTVIDIASAGTNNVNFTITTAGTVTVNNASTGTAIIQNGTATVHKGSLEILSAAVQSLTATGTVNILGNVTIRESLTVNSGTLTVESPADTTATVSAAAITVAPTAEVTVAEGDVVRVTDNVTNAGTLTNNGNVQAAAVANTGTVNNAGTVTGTVTSEASTAPGAAAPVINSTGTITGDVTVTAGSATVKDVAGNVTVNGSSQVTIDGTVSNDVIIGSGSTVTVSDSGTVSGSVDNTSGGTLNGDGAGNVTEIKKVTANAGKAPLAQNLPGTPGEDIQDVVKVSINGGADITTNPNTATVNGVANATDLTSLPLNTVKMTGTVKAHYSDEETPRLEAWAGFFVTMANATQMKTAYGNSLAALDLSNATARALQEAVNPGGTPANGFARYFGTVGTYYVAIQFLNGDDDLGTFVFQVVDEVTRTPIEDEADPVTDSTNTDSVETGR